MVQEYSFIYLFNLRTQHSTNQRTRDHSWSQPEWAWRLAVPQGPSQL